MTVDRRLDVGMTSCSITGIANYKLKVRREWDRYPTPTSFLLFT